MIRTEVLKPPSPILVHYLKTTRGHPETPPSSLVAVDQKFIGLRNRVYSSEPYYPKRWPKYLKPESPLEYTEFSLYFPIAIARLGNILDLCELGNLMFFDPLINTFDNYPTLEYLLHRSYDEEARAAYKSTNRTLVPKRILQIVQRQISRLDKLSTTLYRKYRTPLT